MPKLPSWVTYGRIFHKVDRLKGPACGDMKIGDRETGTWSKVSCKGCLDWREKHKYDRQKRYSARKKAEAEEV